MVVPLLIPVVLGGVVGLGGLGLFVIPKVSAKVQKTKMTKHYDDKKIAKEDLKPGDHIYVLLRSKIGCSESETSNSGSNSTVNALFTNTYHHGVCLDKGEVTDFGSVNETHPVIRPLADFLHSREDCIYRRVYTNAARTPDQVVKVAREYCTFFQRMVNIEECVYKPYHLLNNNCEHYATMLKTEKHWSGQVEKTGFWNCSSAHKRYECCNQERAPAKSASASCPGKDGAARNSAVPQVGIESDVDVGGAAAVETSTKDAGPVPA